MTTQSLIDSIFNSVYTATTIPFLRANTKFNVLDIPTDIYGTYNLTVDNVSDARGDIISIDEKIVTTPGEGGGPDTTETFSELTYTETNSATISVNVTTRIEDTDSRAVLTACQTVYQYVKRLEITGLTIRMNTTVEDRTSYADSQFFYQYGFDIYVNSESSYSNDIDDIRRVTGTITGAATQTIDVQKEES